MEIDSYLSEKQRKRRKREGWLYAAAALVLAYFLIMGAAWMFMGAPFLRVGAVKVEGDSSVPSGDVVALVEAAALRSKGFLYWKAFLGYGNMLVWPSSLSASDLAFDPRLASVTLSKDYWTHTITINVSERAPFGVWCFAHGSGSGSAQAVSAAADAGAGAAAVTASTTANSTYAAPLPVNEDCYLFDANGTMFARTLDTQGSLIYVVHDYFQPDGHLGGSILPAEFTPNLVSVIDVLRGSGIGVVDIELKDLTLEEVDVPTYNGPMLYFSLRFPSDEDLQVLQSLMAKPTFGKLQYVDFRVENRAYYK